ncbi:MAG: cytosol nonspecific dipeptidase, partial [Bacteroidales bacterium]
KMVLANAIKNVFVLAGGSVEFTGQYPGWRPNMESPILVTMKDAYKKLYDKEPGINVIHAGLECGILGAIYPNWDMISFGPTIRSPHSPDERVEIASVEKWWNYLVEVLKNIPQKD